LVFYGVIWVYFFFGDQLVGHKIPTQLFYHLFLVSLLEGFPVNKAHQFFIDGWSSYIASNVVGTPESDVIAECIVPGDPSSLLDLVAVVDASAGGILLCNLSSLDILGLVVPGSFDFLLLSYVIPSVFKSLVDLGR
jgi:hypothetical protein